MTFDIPLYCDLDQKILEVVELSPVPALAQAAQ